MPKTSSIYICQQCGYQSPSFLGKCPECSSWNSLVEQVTNKKNTEYRIQNTGKAEIVNLKDVEKKQYARLSSGLGEFDRVLGGGIVLGSVVLVSGDPGIGKSTLLSQLALNVNQSSAISRQSSEKMKESEDRKLKTESSVLYVAGEESAQQIKIRIDRIKQGADLRVLNEVDVDLICSVIESEKPGLVIIDSIQTLQTTDLTAAPGSVSQVRESALRVQRTAKKLHIPIFIVGHVTKEGTVAGPRTLEHLVDVVLSLEGDSSSQFRILRSNKNRFGPTDEVGVFDMDESGMREVNNLSELFLSEDLNAPGSAVVATLTGVRPMLIDIQALVTRTAIPVPRRVGTGVDNNRLQLLVAVLSKRAKLSLFDQDVFVNATGGLKITEPAADLAICVAIYSSFKDLVIKPKTALIGEVGLLGELRPVKQLNKRIAEAKKLGFKTIISPENAKTLDQAIKMAF